MKGSAPRTSRSSRSTLAVCNKRARSNLSRRCFSIPTAESAKLDTVMASDAWQTHLTRGGLHLDGLGAIRSVTDELVMERMALWSQLIPA